MNPALKLELPIRRFELRCGARLLVSPRPGAPVTAIQMHMRGGHSLDPRGLEGTAFLVGGLLDQGTRRFDEEQIAETLETHGGAIIGESNGMSGSIAAKHWKLLLEMFAELLTSPTYPANELRRQKARLLDRLLLERDEPRVQGEQLFKHLVYGDHWLGLPPTGTIESVRRIERRHVVEFHREQWLGARAIIAVCGDVDPEAVRKVLDRALGRWTRGTDLPYPEPDLPPIAPRSGVFHAQREQVHVFLGHLGIRRADPDYAALVVLDHVLGTGPGFTNRVAMRLRDELGLAYSVHANIHGTAGAYPGSFTAYIGTAPDKVGTAIAGFRAEMKRIQDERVGEAELSVAKDYVVGSFALSFQRAARRAGYMISAERYALPSDYLEQAPRQFAAISSEDVQRAARKHLHPDACCIAAAGPLRKADLQRALDANA
ncbi:MAG: insulinase family protein [Planctomycetes bacterium]|nr:insulinase family protein [Planctomycetota bacterium]